MCVPAASCIVTVISTNLLKQGLASSMELQKHQAFLTTLQGPSEITTEPKT